MTIRPRHKKSPRTSGTAPELALRQALVRAGILGWRPNDDRLFGTPDIVFWPPFPSKRDAVKLAVFVHGCYWHACPRCCATSVYGDPARTTRIYQRDALVEDRLKNNGWRVVVVWEHDLNRGSTIADSCVTEIRCALKSAAC